MEKFYEKALDDVTKEDFKSWWYETEQNAQFFSKWLAYHSKTETKSFGKALDYLAKTRPELINGYKSTVEDNVTALIMAMFDDAKTQLWADGRKLSFKESKK